MEKTYILGKLRKWTREKRGGEREERERPELQRGQISRRRICSGPALFCLLPLSKNSPFSMRAYLLSYLVAAYTPRLHLYTSTRTNSNGSELMAGEGRNGRPPFASLQPSSPPPINPYTTYPLFTLLTFYGLLSTYGRWSGVERILRSTSTTLQTRHFPPSLALHLALPSGPHLASLVSSSSLSSPDLELLFFFSSLQRSSLRPSRARPSPLRSRYVPLFSHPSSPSSFFLS